MEALKQLIKDKDYAAAKAYILDNRSEIEDISDELLSIIDKLRIKTVVRKPFDEMYEHINKAMDESTGSKLDEFAKMQIREHTFKPISKEDLRNALNEASFPVPESPVTVKLDGSAWRDGKSIGQSVNDEGGNIKGISCDYTIDKSLKDDEIVFVKFDELKATPVHVNVKIGNDHNYCVDTDSGFDLDYIAGMNGVHPRLIGETCESLRDRIKIKIQEDKESNNPGENLYSLADGFEKCLVDYINYKTLHKYQIAVDWIHNSPYMMNILVDGKARYTGVVIHDADKVDMSRIERITSELIRILKIN